MKKKVNKKKSDKKSSITNLGVVGLTLAISGIFLIFFSTAFVSPLFLIAALIFSIFQQVKNPIKIGKAALIVSIIGILLYIVWMIILFKVLLPLAQQAMAQGAI